LNVVDEQRGGVSDRSIELVVRADDSGKTGDINEAVKQAYLQGIVTSTSVMPAGLYFDEAVALYRDLPDLGLGVHIALICDYPVRPVALVHRVSTLIGSDGFLYRTLEDLLAGEPDPGELELEFRSQIAKARGTGLDFVYVDGHMAALEIPGVRRVAELVCAEEQLLFLQGGLVVPVPLSLETWSCVHHDDGQVVWVCGPAVTVEQEASFHEGLRSLGPGRWWLQVHPGYREPQSLSVLELLCAPETRRIVAEKKIHLISHRDLWAEVFGV